jgi:hypothetical protein
MANTSNGRDNDAYGARLSVTLMFIIEYYRIFARDKDAADFLFGAIGILLALLHCDISRVTLLRISASMSRDVSLTTFGRGVNVGAVAKFHMFNCTALSLPRRRQARYRQVPTRVTHVGI